MTALAELRHTIGVLRTDEADSIEQPGVDRLDDLARDSRRAGQPVELDVDATVRAGPSSPLGRDLYRIVQEGLTNAQKHAPGAPTTVGVVRTGGTVSVRVANGLTGEHLAVPNAGAALIGLQERVDLAGGTIRFGTTADGDGFELHAVLPWT
jgi:signal transduction histidine kinase